MLTASVFIAAFVARGHRRSLAALVFIGLSHAVAVRTRQFGWRMELRPLLDRDHWVDCAAESMVTGCLLSAAAAAMMIAPPVCYESDSIYLIDKGDQLEIARLTVTVARTHAIITQHGVAHTVHFETAKLGLGLLSRVAGSLYESVSCSSSSEFHNTECDEQSSLVTVKQSHLVTIAPPFRLLGGAGEDLMIVDAVHVDQRVINARRIAKGMRVASREFEAARFRALVRSWNPIGSSANLCCAHAMPGGMGLRPQILELYSSLIEQLRVLGSHTS